MAELGRVGWVLAASTHRDADERFLGEGAVRPTPAGELRACPYPGRRHGRPMNVGALAQVTRRLAHVKRRLAQAQAATDRSLAGAFGAVAACVIEAAAWPEPVPSPVAATYKTLVGMRQVLGRLLLAHDDLAPIPLAELGSGTDFVDLLEREGWLLGVTQVCAGSPRVLVDVYEALAAPPAADPWLAAGAHRDVAVAMVAAQLVDARTDPDPWLVVAHGLDDVRPHRLVRVPSPALQAALEAPSWAEVEELLAVVAPSSARRPCGPVDP